MSPTPGAHGTGPQLGHQGPDQQDAQGASEQDRIYPNLMVEADGQVLLPPEIKARIKDWFTEQRDSGVPKGVARDKFLADQGDTYPYSVKWLDDVVERTYRLRGVVTQEDHEASVEEALEKLLVNDEARERRDATRLQLNMDSIYTIKDLFEMEQPEWLVDGLLPTVGTFQLYGASNTGKSFVALDLLLSVATGAKFLGSFGIGRQGTVVYVAAEGMFDLADRVEGWAESRYSGYPPGDFVTIGDAGLDLRLTPHVDWVIEQCKRLGAVVVVFDTWALHMPGGDENSAKDTGQVVAGLKRMSTELGALIGTVHHTGKNEDLGARGSSAMRAAWDAEFQFTGTQLLHTKARYGPKHEVIGVEMQTVQMGAIDGRPRTTLVPRRVSALGAAAAASLGAERAVLDAVRAMPGRKMTPIREAMKAGGASMHNNTFKRHLEELVAAGQVEERDGGFWVAEEDK